MSCRHIHFVALDRTREFDLRFLGDDAAAQDRGHLLDLRFGHFQFVGDLHVGQVQPHEIEAKHPSTQGPMMACEHGFRQVVERFSTTTAKVMLTVGLDDIVSVFDDVIRMAMGALGSFGPAELPYHLVAFGVVDQSVNVQSHHA